MADIKTTLQNLEITDVGDIVITAVSQDDDGYYVRDIRIFATAVVGAGELSTPLVQLRLRSLTEVALNITSPQSEF
jgi:hypothetical protein